MTPLEVPPTLALQEVARMIKADIINKVAEAATITKARYLTYLL